MGTQTVVSLEDEVASWFAHDPKLQADPYPLYRRLREEAPAYRYADRVLVSTYGVAREVLTDPSTLQGIAAKGTRYRTAAEQLADRQRLELAEMFGFLEKRLGGANGDHHARLRRLAQRAFTPRRVAQMEEQIEAITNSLLDPLVGRDQIELVDDFAFHLPLIVISEMLDISTEDREDLRTWANDLGQFVGANWSDPATVDRTHESVFKLRSYLTDVFDTRRGKETTDLLSALLNASDDGDTFTEDELVAMVTQFIFAGHETSTNLIGNSLVLLLDRQRAHWDVMCADPAVIPSTVEELLRFESPTHYVDKMASQEGVIAGLEVHEWDTISVLTASANRDPDVFDDPDTFDPYRTGPGHLTFGFGAHHCIGASLARMEAAVALRTLTRRFPDMTLGTDHVQWRRNSMLRGPENLPIHLGADHG